MCNQGHVLHVQNAFKGVVVMSAVINAVIGAVTGIVTDAAIGLCQWVKSKEGC